MDTFGIGRAVKMMYQGHAVTRAGWNGRHRLYLQVPDENSKMTEPYVYIVTEKGAFVPWLCSQADLLALDWSIHEGGPAA